MTALTETFHTFKARKAQMRAVVEALGGAQSWVGFQSTQEVLDYLRATDAAYADIGTVGALVEHLGVDLSAINPIILEAARAEEARGMARLNEVANASAKAV